LDSSTGFHSSLIKKEHGISVPIPTQWEYYIMRCFTLVHGTVFIYKRIFPHFLKEKRYQKGDPPNGKIFAKKVKERIHLFNKEPNKHSYF
jgi:hypothetical protein